MSLNPTLWRLTYSSRIQAVHYCATDMVGCVINSSAVLEGHSIDDTQTKLSSPKKVNRSLNYEQALFALDHSHSGVSQGWVTIFRGILCESRLRFFHISGHKTSDSHKLVQEVGEKLWVSRLEGSKAGASVLKLLQCLLRIGLLNTLIFSTSRQLFVMLPWGSLPQSDYPRKQGDCLQLVFQLTPPW